MARLLVVDDEKGVRTFCSDLLRRAGHEVQVADSGHAALRLCASTEFDVVLADINMPHMDGIELCHELLEQDPQQAVILITGYPTVENAVRGMKQGARDYITKPFTPDEIRLVVDRALKERQLEQENEQLRRQMRSRHGLQAMVGDSPAMQQLFALARRAAASPTTVLVEGESGTGKELLARALHVHSERAAQPFITVNCGAFVDSLMESELFGHVKGAFTGAHTNKPGMVTLAHRGTLFLDEIGELPMELQPKLLRLLQEGEVKPVGGVETRTVDVRVVAATNRDLEQEVQQGRFREDLFYRLNVIRLRLPPLRERPSDIPLLAQRFLAACAAKASRRVEGLSQQALDHLLQQRWPGNVRELQNCIERAVILSETAVIDLQDVAPHAAPPAQQPAQQQPAVSSAVGTYPFEGLPLEEVERRHILRTMDTLGGQKTRAAEVLGINRSTLWKKLRQYETDE